MSDAPNAVVEVNGRDLVAAATVDGHALELVQGRKAACVELMGSYEEFVVPCIVNLRLAGPDVDLYLRFPRLSLGVLWPPSQAAFVREPGIMGRIMRAMECNAVSAIVESDFGDGEGFPYQFRFPYPTTDIHFADPGSLLSYGTLCDVVADSFYNACAAVGPVPKARFRVRFSDPVARELFENLARKRKAGTPMWPDLDVRLKTCLRGPSCS
jgi:hypothetical protein